MITSLYDLPGVWLVVVVFAATFLVTAGIYFGVMALAVGERAVALKAVSPGMLPPMGLVFGLVVGFLVAQLWDDLGVARAAVNREASSLRSVVLFARAFPGRPEARLDGVVRTHIHEAVTKEWPAMARQQATLKVIPASLAEGLQVAIALKPRGEGQRSAQREIVSSLQNALEARRERIIVSESTVGWSQWAAVISLAALTLLAIAVVHSANRATAAIAMAIFASAVAVTLIMVVFQDRPFSGQLRIQPDVLVQVLPPQR
jgi:Protein of unknown function (DUF4239)